MVTGVSVINKAWKFATYWVSLFSHSNKACPVWKERTNHAIRGYCPTRWWSKWEVEKQLLDLFGDLEPFFKNGIEEFSTTTCTKLEFLTDPVKMGFLQIEFVAIVDSCMPFVQATYKLESDGPLVLECYEIFSTLTAAVTLGHYPNVLLSSS